MTFDQLSELNAETFAAIWWGTSLKDRAKLTPEEQISCYERYEQVAHLLNEMRGGAQDSEEKKARVFGPQIKFDAVRDLWRRGLPAGDKTGWPSIDTLYTVAPGQLTVVTGWPGSGKSEWLDAMAVNLSRQAWKIVYFSPENSPVELHLAKLMEKVSGRPFGTGPRERIAEDSIGEYLDALAESFGFIEFDSGALTAHGVIEAATPWLSQWPKGAKRGLVIDPWNELEHWRPGGLSETEYVSQTLSFVRNWARHNGVHVWIVAHPQKVPRIDGKLPVPRPDMISGSQHWWNKADCAVTVWRDPERPESRDVDIVVQKIRFKQIGRPGVATLEYDRATGRYAEPRASGMYVVAKDGE
jgi:twinkle protein